MKFRKRFKGLEAITLDLPAWRADRDSNVIPVYGNQQRVALGYNPKKKGRKSYHPLLCFVGETRDYLGGILRSGEYHSSYKAIGFFKGLVKKLPSQIKHIRLRADNGFFNIELIKYLVKEDIDAIVVPMQPWVQRKMWHMTGWSLGVVECDYIVNCSTTLRMPVCPPGRVVVRQKVRANAGPRKTTETSQHGGGQIRLPGDGDKQQEIPEEAWRFCNQRACCENIINEGICGFGLDKVISHSYAGTCTCLPAGQAGFELLMLGYNFMNFFKKEVLNHNRAKAMVSTIREKLFLILGKLVCTARRWVLKLEATWPYKDE